MENQRQVIREVWSHNFSLEMELIEKKLSAYKILAFDTEFPGFLSNTPRNATKELRHRDLHQNVNGLKLIQLGLAFLDDQGNVGGCWQVNFSDFDIERDPHVRQSTLLLEKNGIDFERNRSEGVTSRDFSRRFNAILAKKEKKPRWVAFHAQYDVAYLLRLLSGERVPESELLFVEKLGNVLGVVYDVKYMAESCLNLKKGSLGLEKLSKMLTIERVGGSAHQAGSDCLLTATTFVKLVRDQKLVLNEFEGHLYGISVRVEGRRRISRISVQQRNYIRDLDYYAIVDSLQIGERYLRQQQQECYNMMMLQKKGYYDEMTMRARYDNVPPMSVPYYYHNNNVHHMSLHPLISVSYV